MFRKIFFLLSLLFAQTLFSKESQEVCIAAMFQNESRFLKEWIDYHQSVGVKQFILYNNNSTDDYLEILAPYISSSNVILIDWPSEHEANDFIHHNFEVQIGAYNHALEFVRGKYEWLALIDIDEYIVPVNESTIIKTLKKHFSRFAGLSINWQCYGTSDIWEVPYGKMLETLVMKAPKNHTKNYECKSIVKPKHVKKCVSAHFCTYNHPHYGKNVKGKPCKLKSSSVDINLIRINHYWTKDEKFLHEVKVPRWKRWIDDKDVIREAKELNAVFDPILAR